MTVQLKEPFCPRRIRPLGLWSPEGWRIKTYGIAYVGDSPRADLVDAAKHVALDALHHARDHYGVGFLGVHDGRGANFAFLDWWASENELHHRVWIGPTGNPHALRPATPEDPIACIWDLAVIGFERQAWFDAVIDNPHGSPDVEEYLRRELDASL